MQHRERVPALALCSLAGDTRKASPVPAAWLLFIGEGISLQNKLGTGWIAQLAQVGKPGLGPRYTLSSLARTALFALLLPTLAALRPAQLLLVTHSSVEPWVGYE